MTNVELKLKEEYKYIAYTLNNENADDILLCLKNLGDVYTESEELLRQKNLIPQTSVVKVRIDGEVFGLVADSIVVFEYVKRAGYDKFEISGVISFSEEENLDNYFIEA